MNTHHLIAATVLAAAPFAVLAQAPDASVERLAYMSAGCYQCHGTVGQGGVGPRLAPKPMPLEAMMVFVRHSPRSMPPYDTKVLPDAELRKIHAYLNSIAPSPAAEQIPELR